MTARTVLRWARRLAVAVIVIAGAVLLAIRWAETGTHPGIMLAAMTLGATTGATFATIRAHRAAARSRREAEADERRVQLRYQGGHQ